MFYRFRLDVAVADGANGIKTAFLHLGRGDRSLPELHYWVNNADALAPAYLYYASIGYDTIAHTVFSYRDTWTATYGADAPLKEEEISAAVPPPAVLTWQSNLSTPTPSPRSPIAPVGSITVAAP